MACLRSNQGEILFLNGVFCQGYICRRNGTKVPIRSDLWTYDTPNQAAAVSLELPLHITLVLSP